MTILTKENTENGNTLIFRANKIKEKLSDDSKSIENPPLKKTYSKRNYTLTEEKKETKESAQNKSDKADSRKLEEKKEILIEGVVYDVTFYMKKHPGGSIMRLGLNTDASDAFREFHFRSDRPHKILKVLPSRPYDPEKDENKFLGATKKNFVKDFRKLEQDLKDEGIFDPSPIHITYRIVELVLMLSIGLYMIYIAGPNAHCIPYSLNVERKPFQRENFPVLGWNNFIRFLPSKMWMVYA